MQVALKKWTAKDNLESRVLAFFINALSGFEGYSHAELVFSDGVGFTSFYGIGSTLISRKHPASDWTVFNLSPAVDEIKVRAFAEANLGHPYDLRGVLHFVLPFEQQDRKAYFCSELVVLALQQAGMFLSETSWKVSPNKLYDLLLRSPFASEVV